MKLLLYTILPVLLLSSCSGLKVVTDFDPTVDFTQFRSLEFYGWAENSDAILNEFDKQRIERAFANEFSKRGVEAVKEGGDIVVSLYIVTEQKTQTTAHTHHYGGGWGGYYGYGPGYGWGMGHSTTTYSENEYTVGTLIISIFDPVKEQLIWESIGKGEIEQHPRNAERAINYYVAQIMREYPVKPAK